ncbi:Palmitoyltransferase ZDHHC20-A (Acyltransferase ZDHHC20-A) (Zinc finger DHHC domain-containing protein 20-A) [Durusdinium trenchii]|uniref:Palmitoyltransferase n=1 Tax=Durusdinium trenchii TaxID=1381693 RepID=A0ABP0L685_9DINO
MQALWYTVLVGMLPALVAFLLLRRLEPSVIGHVRRWVRNVALCLTAISLLALWIGGTDVVGIWGLQPLATAGIMSWAPVVYLQSTILWIVVVYNLTHFIGSVDLSVEMDLPFPLQVTYLVLVTLWFSSFLRVLCTRPGKPKDFESEMLSPKPRPNNQVFCVFCQSQKPQRCRHCTKCGACVLRMDHHCPWLRQCIGFGNYKYFVAFITYSAVALLFKAVTLMLFTVRAFHGEITFWTKLWLVSTAAQPIHLLTAYPSPHSGSLGEEALVIALAGTMTAFAAFHLYLCAIGMTTIEFLTRLFPACPPSGDGRTFPHKVLPHDVDKRTKESQRALAISEETALKEKEAR